MRRRVHAAEHQGITPPLSAAVPGATPGRLIASRIVRGLRRLLRLGGFILGVLYGLGLIPLALVRQHPELIAQHWFGCMARLIGLRITAQGKPQGAPVLLVGNHISWIDIIVICAVTPVLFVSKVEVKDWPVVGWLTRAARTLFIERGAHGTAALRQQMQARFSEGFRIVIFPEGTTTDGMRTRRFQPRLFAAAIEGQVPVQPVAIHYRQGCVAYIDDGPSMLGVLWQSVAQPYIDVQLRFGPQLPVTERRDDYARAAQGWVSAELAALHEAYPRL